MPRPRPRVVLVFGNGAEHNSRAVRMTRSLIAAGFAVSWVARAAPGLPSREEHAGYEVLRVAAPEGARWLPAPRLPDAEGPAPEPAGAVLPAGTTPRHGGPGQPLRAERGGLLTEAPGRLLQALRYQLMTRRWAAAVERVAPAADLWQADGLVTLPVALRLRARHGGRVLYDSLEIHVESGRFARLPRPWKRLLGWQERRWARAADAVMTVSRPYADVLARRLGVRPAVVMNCPPAPPCPAPGEPGGLPRPRRFHALLGLPPETPVVLYHGYLFPHRGIERLFQAFALVPGAHLVVMGFGPRFEVYRALGTTLPHAGRVHVIPGVPPEALLEWVASADVAAMPIEGDTLNHRLTTPNKLFEALAAGVPVVTSDLPGMAAIVHATGAGLTCDPADPADIARAIRAILEAPAAERTAYRERALTAARATYNWEHQSEAYLEAVRSLGVARR
ncbi:MAG: glycosyltransferase [Candidatus Limnocylindrales bacterium]